MKFKLILVIILLFELFIGGTGQIFVISGIPLRQILFVVILFTFGFDIFINPKHLKKSSFNWLVIAIIYWALISTLIGFLNGNDTTIIINDLSPVLYFLLFFPLKYYFEKYKLSYSFLYKLLTISSLVVSIFSLSLFYILQVFFDSKIFLFYEAIQDFFGREIVGLRMGGYVFYPGLFYVYTSIILILDKGLSQEKLKIYEKITYLLGLIALVLSMTKGYILVLIIGHVLIFSKNIKSTSQLIKSIFLATLTIYVLVINIDFSESRLSSFSTDSGVNLRFDTFNESIDKFSESIFLGNGFGTELPSKRFHQENSFMDILVEQGIIGISLYVFLFVLVYVFRNRNFGLSIAFFMSYILSLTNPYINNPIGIGLIIMVMIFQDKKTIRTL